MTPRELAEKITQLCLEKKAKDVVLIDLTQLSDISDFFVLASGDSDLQTKTIATHIEKSLKDEKIRLYHKEGHQRLNWVLLDYVDVVAHIFRPDTRHHFDLERLWADAVITNVVDTPPVPTPPDA